MTTNSEDILKLYELRFSEDGGNPDACEGVLWFRSVMKDNSISKIIALLDKKICEGTANHGWILGILRYCWEDIDKEDRLSALNVVVKGGAHKVLLNRKVFCAEFSNEENEILRNSFVKEGATLALRRLHG